MKFFKDPKKWRSELAAIGLAAGPVLFFLSFFVLGNPNVWLLVSCIPLLLPLFFGSWLKMKLPALLFLVLVFLVLAVCISCREITRFDPIKVISPDGKTVAILDVRGNNNCYTVKLDKQVFYTGASIYQKARGVWKNNDLFVLESSDIGPTEFRRESGVWKASPEDHIRLTPRETKDAKP